jgi:plasmid stabilization system protein ParE
MKLPLIVRPTEEADIREIHDYLEQARVGLGSQFAARLRDVLERIESAPASFAVIWNDVRAVRMRKFQCIVYFVEFPDRVEVLAVLHGARHETTWRSRVQPTE